MALRDKIKANAAHLLQPGESIQAVFTAQTTSMYWVFVSYWIILLRNAYRVIVVTDRRIMVCRTGRFRVTPVKGLLAELPRNTQIGPAHGMWYRSESLGEKLYIHKRFHKDIAAADALLPTGPAPADPQEATPSSVPPAPAD
jgi:hypothetical protein